MVIRLIFLGVLAGLVAALLGRKRIAAALLVVSALSGIGLYIYEAVNVKEQNQYFSTENVTVGGLALAPSGHRPNLFLLTGVVSNASDSLQLDGLRLRLELKECPAPQSCQPYKQLEQFVETRLGPGEAGQVRAEVYLSPPFPKGRVEIQHEVLDYRGRKPVW